MLCSFCFVFTTLTCYDTDTIDLHTCMLHTMLHTMYTLAYTLTQSWRVSHERQGMLTLRPTPDSMEGDLMDKNLRLASKFLC